MDWETIHSKAVKSPKFICSLNAIVDKDRYTLKIMWKSTGLRTA